MVRSAFIVFFLIVTRLAYGQSSPDSYIQHFKEIGGSLSHSSVYIQTSKGIYETGEDLWFKSYVLDSQLLTPYLQDSTLYVQLMNVNKEPILYEKFRIINGFVSGHLTLPDSLTSGIYFLTAASPNSFDDNQKEFTAFTRLSVLKRINEPYKISAEFFSFASDGRSEVRVDVSVKSKEGKALQYVNLNCILAKDDSIVNTLQAKTNENGIVNYIVNEHNLTKANQFRILAKRDNDEQTSVVPVPEQFLVKPQLQFFPEGGNLVSGLSNTVAFKISRTDGTPLNISGTLFSDGKPVAEIASIHDGMGKFTFKPIPGKRYTVKLKQFDTTFHLPFIAKSGYTFRLIENQRDSARCIVQKTGDISTSQIYVTVQIRGLIYSIFKGAITGDKFVFVIPTKQYPQGIAEISILDNNFSPVAERLLYVGKEKQLRINQILSKAIVDKREKVFLRYRVTDENDKPVIAHLGVSVYQSLYKGDAEQSDIISYYLLQNQIKGKIYHPAYYFDVNNNDRAEALDLLLTTQGWRRYVWSGRTLEERGLPVLPFKNMMPIQSINKLSSTQTLLGFTPKSVMYKSIKSLGSDNDAHISVSDLEAAKGGYFYIKSLNSNSDNLKISDPLLITPRLIAEHNFPIAFSMNSTENSAFILPEIPGVKHLQEVVIKSKKVIAEFSDKYLASLDSDAVFNNNTDYVGSCGIMNCPVCGSGTKPVVGKVYSKWISDRRPGAHPFAFSPTEVITVKYKITHLTESELMKLYHLVRTKGYAVEKQFYQPNYENDKTSNGTSDFRNTLLWNPEVITDNKGEAVVSFFSSDISGKFIINTEGVDAGSHLGSKQTEMNVLR